MSGQKRNIFRLVIKQISPLPDYPKYIFFWSPNKYVFFFMAMKETFLSNSQTNTFFRVKKLSVSQKSIFSSGHNRKIQSFLFSGYLKYIVHSPKKHFCPFMKEKFLSVHQRNLFSLLTKETAFFVHSSKKYILSIHQRKHFFCLFTKETFLFTK